MRVESIRLGVNGLLTRLNRRRHARARAACCGIETVDPRRAPLHATVRSSKRALVAGSAVRRRAAVTAISARIGAQPVIPWRLVPFKSA